MSHDPCEGPPCDRCGNPTVWVDCWRCHDGFIDEYDEDPINCDPGDTRPCGECRGRGGYWACPNLPHAKGE